MSMPDLKGLLETAQRIQSEVARVREELARKTVNGRGEVLSLVIDPSIIGDKKMVEDLAVGAINLALTRARELAEAELSSATGGMPLPPGLFGG